VEAHADEKNFDSALVEMTIEVRDKKQLERLVQAMRRVPGVRDVERVS
jgi:GTP pyrophosphokinase